MQKKSRLSNQKMRSSYQRLEPRSLLAAMPIITEFVASNSNSFLDDNGNSTDWIEIYNAGDSPADLTGFTLTDDPGDIDKFTFPSTTLAAGDYLLVFAGTDDDPSSGSDLYTDFGLSADGEYLGFFDDSGVALSEFEAGGGDFPVQFTDVSYGVIFDGNFDTVSYFATPTPGEANTGAVDGITSRVTSNLDPGFYVDPISVVLETETVGASIYYTTDGSTPTNTNGTLYTTPVVISSTTNLRAVSVLNNYLSDFDRTYSYLFVDDILDQTAATAEAAGFPDEDNRPNGGSLDYGIDPEVLTIEGREAVANALQSISSISITTDVDNLFDPDTGIYVNALESGREYERPASVELITADGSEGFQVNAGLRIRGGFSRRDTNPKHSFRLFFRSEYGDSELNYNLHGEGAQVNTFQNLDLRTAQNYSWSGENPNINGTNTFITEVISRQNFGLSELTTQSTWAHLYLNGQYWGLYQTQERAEADFAASYLGGDADDYDVVAPDAGIGASRFIQATDGNTDAYFRLFEQADALAPDNSTPAFVDDAAYLKAQGLNPDGTRNPDYEVLLDVDNLINYITEIWYSGNFDSGITRFGGNDSLNNFQAIRDRTGDEGFRFFVHDAEHSLRVNEVNIDRTVPLNDAEFDNARSFNPVTLHQRLMANAEYRLRFADSIQENFFNDGNYTTENIIARWEAEAAKIDSAIIAESARWGDAQRNSPRLRSDWVNAIEDVRDNFLAVRNEIFLEQLRNTIIGLRDVNGNFQNGSGEQPQLIPQDAALFPSVDAPDFFINGANQSGGVIEAGDQLSFAADDVIYYTTDGSDPRLPGGGINPNAFLFDPQAVQTTLVASGDSWRYHDQGDDLGTAWRGNDFNDNTPDWLSGDSELGYGDGDEATVVGFGPDANNKFITTYFRNTFDIPEGDYSAALIRIRRDDGAAIYFNGVEIGRSNLPGGDILFDTPASNVVGGEQESQWFEFAVDPNLFLSGDNTIAVEIHQQNGASSDITFDLEFIVTEQQNAQDFQLDISTNVKARTLSNGEWSAEHNATFVIPAQQSDLRITEINYNPADPTQAEIDAGFDNNDDFEFIELYNPNVGSSINLDGIQFSNGITFEFGDIELLPGERIVVTEDIDAFMARYGGAESGINVIEQSWSGGLSNNGETITLVDSNLDEILSVSYGDDDPWPEFADGAGGTLVLIDPVNTPNSELSKYYRWRASTTPGGTPGAAGIAPSGVVVNEILANTDGSLSDSIELFNATDVPIDISGWWLSDSTDQPFKFQIPAGTILAAGGLISFNESDFNPNPDNPGSNDFALSSLGDQVVLSRDTGTGAVLEDVVDFGATFSGDSLGRLPNGTGRLTRLASNSFGSANGDHATSTLIISEVNYHPEDPNAAALNIEPNLTDGDLEFIEIFNPTDSAIDLTDWRIRGEADYDFAAGTSLEAGESIAVLSFDPSAAANASLLNAFIAHYGLTSSANLVGGLSEGLSNSSGRISLQQPDTPDATGIPRVVVDEVVYDDLSPWADADGSGQSLNRNDSLSYGNLAGSWTAGTATPGITVPAVVDAVINDGSNQRSSLSSVTITLQGDVEVDADAISVIQRSDASGATGTVVQTSHTTSLDSSGNTVLTISFTSLTRNGIGALVDGNYELTIDGMKVRRTGTNVTLGEDFVFGGTEADGFYSLYGDNNGDRFVNVVDLLAFRQTFLQSTGDAAFNEGLDFDGNGIVNVVDLLAFRQVFLTSLPFV